jgi:hypothetical protein
MSLRGVLAPVLAAMALVPALAAAADTPGAVSVASDRSHVTTQLGRSFVFRTRVANGASTPTASLVAHLNILSLRPGVYVDPEDWSSARTQYLGSVPARGSRTLAWTVQAVNSGSFAAYVTVLPRADLRRPPVTGPVVQIAVAKRTTLNSGGILPLAIGIPAFVGLLAGGVHLTRRRR